jgi:hypothetical protein
LDLKPSQLVVAGDPVARSINMKLIDFEAATPVANPVWSLCTPVYLPPEVGQLLGMLAGRGSLPCRAACHAPQCQVSCWCRQTL